MPSQAKLKGSPSKVISAFEAIQRWEHWYEIQLCAMSPWLRCIVKMLEIGLPIAKTVNEGLKLADINPFSTEIDVFNEVLTDLPAIETIDALDNAQLDAKGPAMQHLEGAPLEALHTFLKGHPRPWQGLGQVIADDGTIWWVCERHRKEFEASLISAV